MQTVFYTLTIRWQSSTSDQIYSAGLWGYSGFGGLVTQWQKVLGWIKLFLSHGPPLWHLAQEDRELHTGFGSAYTRLYRPLHSHRGVTNILPEDKPGAGTERLHLRISKSECEVHMPPHSRKFDLFPLKKSDTLNYQCSLMWNPLFT